MSISLTVHEADCTPMEPCRACRAMYILLESSSRDILMRRLKEAVANGGFEVDEHKAGCTPSNPCSNCDFIKLLYSSSMDSTLRRRFIDLLHTPPPKPDATEEERELKYKVHLPIDLSEFSGRAETFLRNENIKVLGELCSLTESQILDTPNVGKSTLKELKEVLASKELRLGMEFPPGYLNPE